MVTKSGPTKAQQIRVELAKLQAAGAPLSQKKVIDALAARGVMVSSGHVSMVAKQFSRFRRSRHQVASQKKNGDTLRVSRPLKRPDFSELQRAAEFAKRCGGLTKAQSLLRELSTLVDPFLST